MSSPRNPLRRRGLWVISYSRAAAAAFSFLRRTGKEICQATRRTPTYIEKRDTKFFFALERYHSCSSSCNDGRLLRSSKNIH